MKINHELKLFVVESGKIAAISMGILIIYIDDKDAGCGRFFQHFWVHQTFQMVERDIPPDIGRRMGGVSLLFAPLKLCSPSATISPCSTIVALFCIGIFFSSQFRFPA